MRMVALSRQHRSEIVVHFDKIGFQLNRPAIGCDRRVELPRRPQCVAELGMPRRRIRPDLQRAAQRIDCFTNVDKGSLSNLLQRKLPHFPASVFLIHRMQFKIMFPGRGIDDPAHGAGGDAIVVIAGHVQYRNVF